MFDLFDAGGHFHFRAAVDDGGFFGAQAEGGAHRVHGCIASPDDGHVLSPQDRCVGIIGIGSHEVDAGKVFVGGEDAVVIFAGDFHEAWQTGSASDKETLVSLFLEIIEGCGAPHDEVGDEFDAHLPEVFDFEVDDGVGEPEFGDAIFEDSPNFMEGFEDGHVVAIFDHIAGKGEGCRA